MYVLLELKEIHSFRVSLDFANTTKIALIMKLVTDLIAFADRSVTIKLVELMLIAKELNINRHVIVVMEPMETPTPNVSLKRVHLNLNVPSMQNARHNWLVSINTARILA